ELIDDNKALPPTDMDPAFFTFEKDGISDNFGLLLIETSTHFSRLANAFIFLRFSLRQIAILSLTEVTFSNPCKF
ncbi:hypothetical protein N9176_02130, partial [bacterium]|nr:hypothetical protein [bacterium]